MPSEPTAPHDNHDPADLGIVKIIKNGHGDTIPT